MYFQFSIKEFFINYFNFMLVCNEFFIKIIQIFIKNSILLFSYYPKEKVIVSRTKVIEQWLVPPRKRD